jgi:catechol 2,3-dioxygenase-like lactoylglutathione lyase family enzyme
LPQLFVSDIEKSCDFYVQKLGFEVGFTYGEPPFYGQVRRDGARLNFRHVDRPVFNAELRAREDLVAATGIVEAVKSLFLEDQEHGVAFHQALRTEPWGARTFIVADPGGNLICLATENA